MRRVSKVRSLIAFAVAAAAACGSTETTVGPEPNDEIEPFVGTWDAEVFEVTSDADTTIVANLTENGFFTLNVQPSGTYTATLVFGDLDPVVEIGQLSVTGSVLTLRPNGGEPGASQFTFLETDLLRLEGPTEFPFRPPELEPGQAIIVLRRR